MTPPLVIAIFLGIFWKRYTAKAAIATFILGAILMWLGAKFPGTLIAPFDHGIEMHPDHPYSYIRALYNTLVCLGAGVGVGLLTKPNREEKLEGLTAWSLDKAREYFKGGKPNDRPGELVNLRWVALESGEEIARFARQDMETMGADEDDLVYICDRRKWLGGLKSVHTRYGEPHEEAGVVYLSPDLIGSAMFDAEKPIYAEKEM